MFPHYFKDLSLESVENYFSRCVENYYTTYIFYISVWSAGELKAKKGKKHQTHSSSLSRIYIHYIYTHYSIRPHSQAFSCTYIYLYSSADYPAYRALGVFLINRQKVKSRGRESGPWRANPPRGGQLGDI